MLLRFLFRGWQINETLGSFKILVNKRTFCIQDGVIFHLVILLQLYSLKPYKSFS